MKLDQKTGSGGRCHANEEEHVRRQDKKREPLQALRGRGAERDEWRSGGCVSEATLLLRQQ